MRRVAGALFWFGVAGFCLALLGSGAGVTIAALCWLGALVAFVISVLV